MANKATCQVIYARMSNCNKHVSEGLGMLIYKIDFTFLYSVIMSYDQFHQECDVMIVYCKYVVNMYMQQKKVNPCSCSSRFFTLAILCACKITVTLC